MVFYLVCGIKIMFFLCGSPGLLKVLSPIIDKTQAQSLMSKPRILLILLVH